VRVGAAHGRRQQLPDVRADRASSRVARRFAVLAAARRRSRSAAETTYIRRTRVATRSELGSFLEFNADMVSPWVRAQSANDHPFAL